MRVLILLVYNEVYIMNFFQEKKYVDFLTSSRSNSPRLGISGNFSFGYLLVKFEYSVSSRGDPCSLTNCDLSILFMGVMLAAWAQNESCTAANVISYFLHSSEVYIIWVESREWTKLGGKAVFYFCLLTGWSSRLPATERDWMMVVIMFFWL